MLQEREFFRGRGEIRWGGVGEAEEDSSKLSKEKHLLKHHELTYQR